MYCNIDLLLFMNIFMLLYIVVGCHPLLSRGYCFALAYRKPVILLDVHHLLVVLHGSCLQVLEGVIKYRWNALPVEQRDGMKNYISEVIVQVLAMGFFQWIVILA